MRIDATVRVSLRSILGTLRAAILARRSAGLSFPTMYNCRECETEINQGTEICPHCGADLTLSVAGADPPAAKQSLQKILLRWGVLLGVLLAAIWSFLWFVVPERPTGTDGVSEAELAKLITAEGMMGVARV